MEQQYGDDFISITDEDGKEYELEVLAELEHDGSRYLVALYRADRFSGTLRASDEGRVFWVERSEFARMNVIWNMKEGSTQVQQYLDGAMNAQQLAAALEKTLQMQKLEGN